MKKRGMLFTADGRRQLGGQNPGQSKFNAEMQNAELKIKS
jgi:hypothetical protein